MRIRRRRESLPLHRKDIRKDILIFTGELLLRIKDVDLRDFFEEILQFGHKFWFFILFLYLIFAKNMLFFTIL